MSADDREVQHAIATIAELSDWLTWANDMLRRWAARGEASTIGGHMWDGNDAALLVERVARMRDAYQGIKREDDVQKRVAIMRAIDRFVYPPGALLRIGEKVVRRPRADRIGRWAGVHLAGVSAVCARVRETHPELADQIAARERFERREKKDAKSRLQLAIEAWPNDRGGRGRARWPAIADLMASLGLGQEGDGKPGEAEKKEWQRHR